MTEPQTGGRPPDARGRSHFAPRTGPALVLPLLVSFAHNWNYLRGGFHAHDLFFLNMLRQGARPYSHWLGAVHPFPPDHWLGWLGRFRPFGSPRHSAGRTVCHDELILREP